MTAFEDSLAPPPSNDAQTPYSLPLPHPNQDSKPVAPKPLTADQKEKLDRLVNHFNAPEFVLPNSLKALKARWQKDAGGASRLGSLFGRSATATDQEVRPSPCRSRPRDGLAHLSKPLADPAKTDLKRLDP